MPREVVPSGPSTGSLDADVWQAAGAAEEATDVVRNSKVPRGVGLGLGLLGPAMAAYGTYDDVQNGESLEQAAASQSGGLLAGMAGGGAVGLGIGTAGFPIVGTIVGGVVGAVTGAIVSNEIDEHYEEREAAEAAAAAEAERHRQEELLMHMLNASEGLPLYATPGSHAPLPEEQRP